MDGKLLKDLAMCKLFNGIETAELEKMINCLNPSIRKFNKNELLAVAGEKFDGIGIILNGEAAVTKENMNGTRVIISVVGSNDLFGELAAFSGKGQWPATVVAQKGCHVIYLPPGKILGTCPRQCHGHKELIKNMLSVVSGKALMLNRKLEYLSIKSLRGKICTFLMEEYNKTSQDTLIMTLKRNELADFLNVSRPSLSREMCKMRDEGMIEFQRENIRITDLEAVKSYAE